MFNRTTSIVVIVVLVLIVLAFLAHVFWSYRKQHKLCERLECLEEAQCKCCAKSYLSVIGTGGIDSITGPFLVQGVTWDAAKSVEYPSKKWDPVFSTIDTTQIIGWKVPVCGIYDASYTIGLGTFFGGFGFVLVNGKVLIRSVTWTFDSSTPVARQVGKSFLVSLNKGDVVSTMFVPFAPDQLAAGILGPLSGLTLNLIDKRPAKHVDNLADFIPNAVVVLSQASSASMSSVQNQPLANATLGQDVQASCNSIDDYMILLTTFLQAILSQTPLP